ncbi:MAG TPA: serine hydrolase, partial [Thermomicrobiaceae bacterium]|nr:serine hydrolase [Thermomicrobiaceae bacterium]
QTVAGNFAEHYGLGWALHTVGGERVIGHGGTTNGFQAQLQLVPSRDFAVAVLTNSNRGAAAAREIIDWVLAERLGLREEAQPTFALGADALAGFAGRYVRPRVVVEVTPEDAGLVVRVTTDGPEGSGRVTNPPIHLRPIAEREFVIEDGESAGVRVDFLERPDDGRHIIRLGGRLAECVD